MSASGTECHRGIIVMYNARSDDAMPVYRRIHGMPLSGKRIAFGENERKELAQGFVVGMQRGRVPDT